MNRREILKTLAIGAVGAGIAGCRPRSGKITEPDIPVYTGHGRKATFQKVLTPSNVSLIQASNSSLMHCLPKPTG